MRIRYIRFSFVTCKRLSGSRLYIFRVAKTHKLQIEGNLTQDASLNTNQSKRQNNLLKQFQTCIKDREPYPTVRLTCSEYGKLLENKIRVSRNRLKLPVDSRWHVTIDFAAACGRRRSVYGNLRVQKRIVGGVESAPGDWPFLAALLGGPEQIFYCAGVLIADQWVLTASHCVGK